MLYKPKYCCQCGEKIERIDWKLWSSRRFCEFCETEVGHYDWAARLILGVGVFLGIFGFGNYFLASEAPPETVPHEIVRRSFLNKDVTDAKRYLPEQSDEQKTIKKTDKDQNDDQSAEKPRQAPVEKVAATDKRIEDIRTPQNDSAEPVYYCGAETKKGTPCSRRVKGGGRCWQHPGREAMLPEEDLIVNR